MTEPKGLFGAKPAAIATPTPPQIQPMQVAPTTGQALVPQAPFTIQEAMDFGHASEMRAASVVQKINAATRAGDLDEMGKKLNQLSIAGQQYDPSKLKPGGFFGFMKKKKREIEAHFKTVDAQVNTIASDIDQQVGHFRSRIGDIAALAVENQERHRELGLTMEEAERRIAWMKANPPAVDTTDAFSAQRLASWNQAIAFAEKRVEDMRGTRLLCEMTGPQIDLMATNAGMLVMTFGEVKATTLPQMQMQFALFIINMETEKGAQFIKNVRDTNNELIKKNADKLGAATVLVRQEMGRSSVDLATLEHVRTRFFETLDKVKQIEVETAQRLAADRPKIEQMSQDLMQRLSQQAA